MKHYTLFICLYPDQCELLGKILWDWNVSVGTYLFNDSIEPGPQGNRWWYKYLNYWMLFSM